MGSQPEPPFAPSQAPIRLAILECDVPTFPSAARFPPVPGTSGGGYGAIFADLFTRAVAPAPLSSVIALSTHRVIGADNDPAVSYPAPGSVDAVLLTGSLHDAFADEPWIVRLTDYVRGLLLEGRTRIVGICFGHQIIGRALGAVVGRNDGGWETSVTEIRLSEKGKELFGGETLRIHQMHQDVVGTLPPGTELLGETDVCANQGFLVPGKAITVQGHPEFGEAIMRDLLEMRHKSGRHSDDIYQSGMARAADEHDGLRIARAFLRFLRE